MSFDIAIQVENLSKCYHIYDKPRDRLKQFMLPRLRKIAKLPPTQYFREFWALRNISFEIRKGQTVGIVGHNGSGKSTLLQLICGTLNPTDGTIYTRGRIAALLELGSGFNPEFTGRENIYMNGAVLGLTIDEINSRFEDIVAFADIGDFLEQPVKTYSSGMFVRLAFSVNIMSQPDIMVVDEALAVGDMAFQAKCMTALRRMQDNGTTILFVSHDIGSIKSLCDQAIFLKAGKLVSHDNAATVAEAYIRLMREVMNEQGSSLSRDEFIPSHKIKEPAPLQYEEENFKTSKQFDARVAQFRYGEGGARITFAELLDLEDRSLTTVEFNQEVKIRIHFYTEIEAPISVNYYIQDDKKNLILGSSLRQAGASLISSEANGRYIVTYKTVLPLQEGNYSIQFQLTKPLIPDQSAVFLDVIDDVIVFNVLRREQGRIWAKVYISNSVEVLQS